MAVRWEGGGGGTRPLGDAGEAAGPPTSGSSAAGGGRVWGGGGRGGPPAPGYKSGGGGGSPAQPRHHARCPVARAGAAPLPLPPRRALVQAPGRTPPVLGGQSLGAALRAPPPAPRPPLPHRRHRTAARPVRPAPRRGTVRDGCVPRAAELLGAAWSPQRSPVQGRRDRVLGPRGVCGGLR